VASDGYWRCHWDLDYFRKAVVADTELVSNAPLRAETFAKVCSDGNLRAAQIFDKVLGVSAADIASGDVFIAVCCSSLNDELVRWFISRFGVTAADVRACGVARGACYASTPAVVETLVAQFGLSAGDVSLRRALSFGAVSENFRTTQWLLKKFGAAALGVPAHVAADADRLHNVDVAPFEPQSRRKHLLGTQLAGAEAADISCAGRGFTSVDMLEVAPKFLQWVLAPAPGGFGGRLGLDGIGSKLAAHAMSLGMSVDALVASRCGPAKRPPPLIQVTDV
jgi:hypothetical protein